MIKKLVIWSVYGLILGGILILHKRLYPAYVVSLVISVALMTVGAAIALAGKWALGKYHTTLPGAQKLISDRIYSKIRHPIYTGIQLAFWRLCLWFSSLVGFILNLVMVFPLHVWRARVEEKVLIQAFCDEYMQYKSKTFF